MALFNCRCNIINKIKSRVEAEGLSISEETDDGSICIIYASGEIDGRPLKAMVTYFSWPRIIKVSIELSVIKKPKRHIACSLFLDVINDRLCPGHFKINETGHVTLEAGMFTFEHVSEEDGVDYEWPLDGEFHLLMDHLLEAARTYLPLIECQAGSSESVESIIRSFEDGLKESDRSSLQDIGIELE